MSQKPHVVSPEQRETAMDVLGAKITALGSPAAMRDLQITLQSGAEGIGPPPHSHAWDESFYVTNGQVIFVYGDETTTCGAGTLFQIPAGTIHAFAFGPGGGEMLEITGKGSNAIQMFTALSQEIPPGPPDVPKVVEVLANHGVTAQV